MIKLIFFLGIIFIVGFFSALFLFADDISNKLTDSLNRNLDVDWGTAHPKFKKKNLIFDVLDMSLNWDDLKINFPNTQTSHMRNLLSELNMNDCKSKISIILKLRIFIKCKKILIQYSKNKWIKKGDMKISRTFFFERRIFDDLYDKQGSINVRLDTEKLIINNKNLGYYSVENSFIDEKNLEILINDEEVIFTKKEEGLIIKTLGTDYFFLNQIFFNNVINRYDIGV